MASWYSKMYSWGWEDIFKINDQPVREWVMASLFIVLIHVFSVYVCNFRDIRNGRL